MRGFLLFCASGLVASAGHRESKNPCEVITKVEAEAVVDGKLEGPQLSPKGTLCKYFETGYGEDPSKHKLVTIGLFYSNTPDPEAVYMRPQFALRDQSLKPVVWHELPDFGDAAI